MNKLLFILYFFVSISCTKSPDRVERVKVIRTLDGDTFDALTEKGEVVRIRMAYIDAPELAQPFGLLAFAVLDSLIRGKTILIYKTDRDMYGRTVAIAYDSMHKSINEFMVERGMAYVYPQYAPKALYEKQLKVKKNKQGLWVNPYPTAPYIYRKQHKLE